MARIDIVLRSCVPDEQAVKSGCRSEAATHVVEFKAWIQQRELLFLLFRLSNLGFNGINLESCSKKSQHHFGVVVTAHGHM